jgi:hypothetical protein
MVSESLEPNRRFHPVLLSQFIDVEADDVLSRSI